MFELNMKFGSLPKRSDDYDDGMWTDWEYGRKYKGRRLIVLHHFDPHYALLNHRSGNDLGWRCGYMQALPEDKNYDMVKDYEFGYLDFDSMYPHAAGGVTLVGHTNFDPITNYVGFDTAHCFTKGMSAKDCLKALKAMARIDQVKINKENIEY